MLKYVREILLKSELGILLKNLILSLACLHVLVDVNRFADSVLKFSVNHCNKYSNVYTF